MTDRATREGQNLGNYRLLHLLGRGGFAEVYLAQHRRLNTQAAIKVLHTQLADEDIDDFQREAQTVAALLHSHIVRVLDFDVQGGIPFLVMDYAPNGSLRRLHPKGSMVPLPTIISYVKQIAEALQYAHDQKLIHRDVKPENMLIGRHSDLLLSDFGIATITQSSRYQSTQEVVGTVAYMAPEQVQGKPRPASDQYALGIVVYEWLSGTRPFHGSFTEIATQQVLALPPPLREKVPTISQEVEQVVLTALAKDPKQRFASVLAFVTALEQASQTIQSPSIRLQPLTSSPALRDSSNTLPANSELARPTHPEPDAPPAPKSSRGSSSNFAAAQTPPSIPPKRPPARGGFFRGRVVILMALTLITIVGAIASFSYVRSTPVPAVVPPKTVTPQSNPTVTLASDLLAAGELTVGSDTTNPPQEYLDPNNNNQPTGFDIDLITAIAKKMGLQARIVSTPFGSLFRDLRNHQLDVVISAVSMTSDLTGRYDFVSYLKTSESLLVPMGNPKHIKQLIDLCGLSVGVQAGSTEFSDLQKTSNTCQTNGNAAINIVQGATETNVIQLLLNGTVDATYQDTPVANYYMGLNQGKFTVYGMIPAPDEAIVIRKGDNVMLKAVQTAFNQLKQDKTYSKLINMWGLTQEELAVIDRRSWPTIEV